MKLVQLSYFIFKPFQFDTGQPIRLNDDCCFFTPQFIWLLLFILICLLLFQTIFLKDHFHLLTLFQRLTSWTILKDYSFGQTQTFLSFLMTKNYCILIWVSEFFYQTENLMTISIYITFKNIFLKNKILFRLFLFFYVENISINIGIYTFRNQIISKINNIFRMINRCLIKII